jgi:hypothetical protein
MTEAEWWAATYPDDLIDWLFFDAAAADRKIRLFCVACCRRIDGFVAGTPFTELLRLIEAFADGVAGEREVEESSRLARNSHCEYPSGLAANAGKMAFLDAARDLFADRWRFYRSREWYRDQDDRPYPEWVASEAREEKEYQVDDFSGQVDVTEGINQVHLLHDLFGPLPFRDVVVAPEWLTSDVLALARGIYDEKAFDRMPILADALQDAGCDNVEILDHCRKPDWEHVRGCWVIDLILGRPWREPT